MIAPECPRERDVFEAVAAGRFPDRCPELAAHVDACRACAESLAMARAFGDEYRHATVQAPLPSASAMWWRIELRARREALRAATRPITVVQGLAAAAALGMIAALAGLLGPWLRGLATSMAGLAAAYQWTPFSSQAALLLGMLIMLASVAVYFALRDDAR